MRRDSHLPCRCGDPQTSVSEPPLRALHRSHRILHPLQYVLRDRDGFSVLVRHLNIHPRPAPLRIDFSNCVSNCYGIAEADALDEPYAVVAQRDGGLVDALASRPVT